MARNAVVQKTSHSRVFLIDGGASPRNRPSYKGFAKAGAVSFSQGDISPIRVPSDSAYEQFDVVDSIRGQPGLPSMGVDFLMQRTLSEVLSMAKRRCVVDVQVHIGACKNPSDFNNGWDKIHVIESAGITDYSTGDLGALDADANAPVMESVGFTGQEYYELKRLAPQTIGAASITDEVVKVLICDQLTCAECGIDSNGCQNVFVVTTDTSGSPGLNARLLYSRDGGSTFTSAAINTIGAAEVPVDATCMGAYLVIYTGGSSDRLHFALISEILRGTASWTAVSTGFVAAGSPIHAYAYNSEKAWVVGALGYAYTVTDPTVGATARMSGDLTAQNLNGVHSYDGDSVVIVGAANVVLLSRNAGVNWVLQTGPAAGVILNAVWMHSPNSWTIGSDAGRLYYTVDAGLSYTEINIPDAGSGAIKDISFATRAVGYLGRTMTSNPRAQVLRTISGGQSWFRAEGLETMPTGQTINSIAACKDDPNLVFGGGQATDLSDGFLVKLA